MAMQKLNQAIHTLYNKHNNGNMTVYLINSVIIARLNYALQLTNVSNSKLEEIDRKLRKVVKAKIHKENKKFNNTQIENNIL